MNKNNALSVEFSKHKHLFSTCAGFQRAIAHLVAAFIIGTAACSGGDDGGGGDDSGGGDSRVDTDEGVDGGSSDVTAGTVSNGDKTVDLTVSWVGQATSFTQRGDDEYAVGFYVSDGEMLTEYSLLADEDESVSKLDLDVQANGLGFSAVIAHGEATDLTLTGSIAAMDEGDGNDVSDFSGLGSMIVASDSAMVRVESMDIATTGFARAAFIVDDHANVLVRDSNVTAWGANPLTDAYEGYVNSANTTQMISPPWVLGIQGGVRASNMLGDGASLSVSKSVVTSGSWGVLSTDSCSEPRMTVVDSSLRILPESKGGMSSGRFSYSADYGSGYGTYAIGNATQSFHGVHFEGMTYATIFTGGEATYASSNGTIELLDGEGNAIDAVEGDGEPTVIDSVWGFMSHGDATINVLDGTEVSAAEAIFLYKAGAVTVRFDEAVLNSGAGVILQMMDNDDTIVGGDINAFNTEFNEDPGWPSMNGNVSAESSDSAGVEESSDSSGPPEDGSPPGGIESGAATGANQVDVSMTNGEYVGDLYNGTGYYGQSSVPLVVSIGEGATLQGTISLTETRHIDESGEQNTYFTIDEYYYLGHVANRNYRNGYSEVDVTVNEGGVWKVTGESLLTSLTLGDGQIIGAGDRAVVLTIDGERVELVAGTYEGEVVVSLE